MEEEEEEEEEWVQVACVAEVEAFVAEEVRWERVEAALPTVEVLLLVQEDLLLL